MILGRVVGNVVSTAKLGALRDKKLLLVAREGADDEAAACELLAVDAVGAGVGERVLVVLEGRSAATAAGRPGTAIDAAVVGIVDQIV